MMKNKACNYMNLVADEFIDGDSGLYTQLAEDTADSLDIYEADGFTIPEWLFDMAVDILDGIISKQLEAESNEFYKFKAG
jgi:hypothetical protein